MSEPWTGTFETTRQPWRCSQPCGVVVAEVVGVGFAEFRECVNDCRGVCVRVVESNSRLSLAGLAGSTVVRSAYGWYLRLSSPACAVGGVHVLTARPRFRKRSSLSIAYCRHSSRTGHTPHTLLASRVEPPFREEGFGIGLGAECFSLPGEFSIFAFGSGRVLSLRSIRRCRQACFCSASERKASATFSERLSGIHVTVLSA